MINTILIVIFCVQSVFLDILVFQHATTGHMMLSSMILHHMMQNASYDTL